MGIFVSKNKEEEEVAPAPEEAPPPPAEPPKVEAPPKPKEIKYNMLSALNSWLMYIMYFTKNRSGIFNVNQTNKTFGTTFSI